MNEYELQLLPPSGEIEIFDVLKRLSTAHRHLAEFKGIVPSIPNQSILLSTLSLQEAKDSSEIENIVTTHMRCIRQNYFRTLYRTLPPKK